MELIIGLIVGTIIGMIMGAFIVCTLIIRKESRD